jgi:HD superfamily phosphohydrolase
MDYLARDSYYCGTSYGHVESDWLIANLMFHIEKENVHLALNRKAIYTFDDFLISRLHMFLLVYFHHKAIVYDEMLLKYLKSNECYFFLPSNIEEYIQYDDYKLHTHLAESHIDLAKMISNRKPYRLLFETHEESSDLVYVVSERLAKAGMDYISTSSTGRLSKYYSESTAGGPRNKGHDLFVIEETHVRPRQISKIEDATEIFKKYERARKIERLYVRPEDYEKALAITQ